MGKQMAFFVNVMMIVNGLIPCVDSKCMNKCVMWSCFLIVSFSLCPQLCFSLPIILVVSTSKFRKQSCLGGTLSVLVLKEKTGYLL